MSLVIKGMGMPKNCNECPMYFYEGQGICSCRVLSTIEDDEVLKPWKKKRKDCPLIEIPDKHGRLIDADALAKDYDGFPVRIDPWVWNELSHAPTIIPAEEGE